ncbi:MAG: Na/Pi cotransporter family protein [Clostridia bacterium]|nr:Na/Pi cotransporter family protein [Clostridia bacterium]
MDFFDYLSLAGGVSLFLFGMKYLTLQAQAAAGENLRKRLVEFTGNKYRGFLFGFFATAFIQSSSAVTSALTQFVGASVLPLENAAGIIIGSNVGTTATSWLTGVAGIKSDIPFFRFLNTLSLASVFSVSGIIVYHIGIKNKKRNFYAGMIFGFAMIMYGLFFMSDSAQELKTEERALRLFSELSKPAAGFIAGLAVAALTQSSSVSIGILQSVSLTGALSIFSCVPIILGQNVGACVTALAACVSGNKSSKAAALIHLYFNLFSSALFYALMITAVKFFEVDIFYIQANSINIAVVHTAFNIFAAAVMMPFASQLQEAAFRTVDKCAEYRSCFRRRR